MEEKNMLMAQGIAPLVATDIVEPKGLWVGVTSSRRDNHIYSRYELTSIRDSKRRSKTFQGIARAMATQWTQFIELQGEQ